MNTSQARCCIAAGMIGVLISSSAVQTQERRERRHTVPFFPSASHVALEGFTRLINRSPESGEVRINAVDDAGLAYGPITLPLDPFEAVHFNSADLEGRGAASALFSGIGPALGDWRLEFASELDIEVLSYAVSPDGFLAAMHDAAPGEGPRHRVATFNPADNAEPPSLLRLINPGETAAHVAVTGMDDSGRSPGEGVTLSILPGASRTLTSSELESGIAPGLNGSLGDGIGKWRLSVESSQPVLAMSLLSSPVGHLTNLSTSSANENDRTQFAPLFPSASDPYGRQGLVRLVNRSEVAGAVTITAHDRSGWQYEPLTLAIGANETAHFDSNDLELGNARAGLAGSTGPGKGDWWLELSSELDVEALSYIRAMDGTVNAMHDTAPKEYGGWRIAFFNPAGEVGRASLLRLVNPSDEDALAVITGVDDRGMSPGTEVRLTVPARQAATLSALELESGGAAFEGALGDGLGKWRLMVRSETELIVTNLLSSPTGRLTNLSTVPSQDRDSLTARPDLEVGTPQVSDDGPVGGAEFSMSVSVLNSGDGSSSATALRYFRSTNATISTLDSAVGADHVRALPASGSGAHLVTLMAPFGAGTFYYGACVDPVPGESETTDNCSAPVRVRVEEPAEHPDLEAGTPSISDNNPVAGHEFLLSVPVRNAGDAPSPATTLRYYRSINSTISTLDAEVVTDGVGALPASGSRAALAALSAPTSSGIYYYGACVDPVPGESETTDNCSAAVRVRAEEPAEHPDLEVGTPSISDNSPVAGHEFSLSVPVRNAGDAPSPATTLRYYRSVNSTISTLDAEVATDGVGALPASGSRAALVTLAAPPSSGTYYYGACVDAVFGESETTDNCSRAVRLEVSEAEPESGSDLEESGPDLEESGPDLEESGPDLEVVSVSAEVAPDDAGAVARPGASFTLSAAVRNAGDAESAATTLRFYRSDDAAISPSDAAAGTAALGPLPAGGSAARSAALTAPQDPGTYYYGACVDAVAGESDTADNCSAAVLVLVAPPPPSQSERPDWVVAYFGLTPKSVNARERFVLTALVRNSGDGDAAVSPRLRYYYSLDAAISSDDTEVGSDLMHPPLEASASREEAIFLTAPSYGGTYHYYACVDAIATESDTSNNCSRTVALTVAGPPRPQPDLMVHSPYVTIASPIAEQSFTLGATVRNQGDVDAGATTLRYYLSSDGTIATSDTQVGTVAVADLPAYTSREESVDLTAPKAPGTYHYGACVDPVPGESETTDNCSAAVSVTVFPPSTGSSHYGAFAFEPLHCVDHAVGIVVDRRSEREALNAAQQACLDDGGTVRGCSRPVSFRQCLAVGFGTGDGGICAGSLLAEGSTLAAVESAALARCEADVNFSNCSIAASGCNSPSE